MRLGSKTTFLPCWAVVFRVIAVVLVVGRVSTAKTQGHTNAGDGFGTVSIDTQSTIETVLRRLREAEGAGRLALGSEEGGRTLSGRDIGLLRMKLKALLPGKGETLSVDLEQLFKLLRSASAGSVQRWTLTRKALAEQLARLEASTPMARSADFEKVRELLLGEKRSPIQMFEALGEEVARARKLGPREMLFHGEVVQLADVGTGQQSPAIRALAEPHKPSRSDLSKQEKEDALARSAFLARYQERARTYGTGAALHFVNEQFRSMGANAAADRQLYEARLGAIQRALEPEGTNVGKPLVAESYLGHRGRNLKEIIDSASGGHDKTWDSMKLTTKLGSELVYKIGSRSVKKFVKKVPLAGDAIDLAINVNEALEISYQDRLVQSRLGVTLSTLADPNSRFHSRADSYLSTMENAARFDEFRRVVEKIELPLVNGKPLLHASADEIYRAIPELRVTVGALEPASHQDAALPVGWASDLNQSLAAVGAQLVDEEGNVSLRLGNWQTENMPQSQAGGIKSEEASAERKLLTREEAQKKYENYYAALEIAQFVAGKDRDAQAGIAIARLFLDVAFLQDCLTGPPLLAAIMASVSRLQQVLVALFNKEPSFEEKVLTALNKIQDQIRSLRNHYDNRSDEEIRLMDAHFSQINEKLDRMNSFFRGEVGHIKRQNRDIQIGQNAIRAQLAAQSKQIDEIETARKRSEEDEADLALKTVAEGGTRPSPAEYVDKMNKFRSHAVNSVASKAKDKLDISGQFSDRKDWSRELLDGLAGRSGIGKMSFLRQALLSEYQLSLDRGIPSYHKSHPLDDDYPSDIGSIDDYVKNARHFAKYASAHGHSDYKAARYFDKQYCDYDKNLVALREMLDTGYLQREAFRKLAPVDAEGRPDIRRLLPLMRDYELAMRDIKDFVVKGFESKVKNSPELMNYDPRIIPGDPSFKYNGDSTTTNKILFPNGGFEACPGMSVNDSNDVTQRNVTLRVADKKKYLPFIPDEVLAAVQLGRGKLHFCYDTPGISPQNPRYTAHAREDIQMISMDAEGVASLDLHIRYQDDNGRVYELLSERVKDPSAKLGKVEAWFAPLWSRKDVGKVYDGKRKLESKDPVVGAAEEFNLSQIRSRTDAGAYLGFRLQHEAKEGNEGDAFKQFVSHWQQGNLEHVLLSEAPRLTAQRKLIGEGVAQKKHLRDGTAPLSEDVPYDGGELSSLSSRASSVKAAQTDIKAFFDAHYQPYIQEQVAGMAKDRVGEFEERLRALEGRRLLLLETLRLALGDETFSSPEILSQLASLPGAGSMAMLLSVKPDFFIPSVDSDVEQRLTSLSAPLVDIVRRVTVKNPDCDRNPKYHDLDAAIAVLEKLYVDRFRECKVISIRRELVPDALRDRLASDVDDSKITYSDLVEASNRSRKNPSSPDAVARTTALDYFHAVAASGWARSPIELELWVPGHETLEAIWRTNLLSWLKAPMENGGLGMPVREAFSLASGIPYPAEVNDLRDRFDGVQKALTGVKPEVALSLIKRAYDNGADVTTAMANLEVAAGSLGKLKKSADFLLRDVEKENNIFRASLKQLEDLARWFDEYMDHSGGRVTNSQRDKVREYRDEARRAQTSVDTLVSSMRGDLQRVIDASFSSVDDLGDTPIEAFSAILKEQKLELAKLKKVRRRIQWIESFASQIQSEADRLYNAFHAERAKLEREKDERNLYKPRS